MATTRRFVALDRDGTLNVERNYLLDPDEVELIPGVIEGLRLLREAGLGLVVVTNQSAVSRGWLSEERLAAVHERLQALLATGGVSLDGIYYCPHDPSNDCVCRKPAPGLLLRAAAEHGFDPIATFVVGDKAADVQLARAVGATSCLVRTGHGRNEEPTCGDQADFVADDLLAAARRIVTLLDP